MEKHTKSPDEICFPAPWSADLDSELLQLMSDGELSSLFP
jgi:hypothetical protein